MDESPIQHYSLESVKWTAVGNFTQAVINASQLARLLGQYFAVKFFYNKGIKKLRKHWNDCIIIKPQDYILLEQPFDKIKIVLV